MDIYNVYESIPVSSNISPSVTLESRMWTACFGSRKGFLNATGIALNISASVSAGGEDSPILLGPGTAS